MRRCIDAGRFQPAEPTTSLAWAAELWAMRHGVVTLALSDLLPPEQVSFLLADGTYRLAVGYGDGRASADASVERGLRSSAEPEAPVSGSPM
ncbi:MAG: hypothetical protein QOE59_5084 [Actinomycetota bacterium]|nr:hypothetical protein [Actinomycetota bacterium]